MFILPMNLAVRIFIVCVALNSICCDSGPTQSISQQFDPAFLKTFPKWSITFHAVGNFRGFASSSPIFELDKYIVSFNNFDRWFANKIWPQINWSGATSTADSSYVSTSGGGGGSTYDLSEYHSYQATIATTNTVSGSCSTSYNRQETYHNSGGYHEYYSFSMKYSGIPLQSVTSDSIIFYLSGDSLRSKISEIKRVDGEISPDYYLVDIAWDQQPVPSLRIVFYK